mgnify:CR=1 FL=1
MVGVHLALSRMPGTLRTGSRGCCTIEDSMDAQRAANVLGIPYYVWDLSERFEQTVVADFLAEYRRGRTPNPKWRRSSGFTGVRSTTGSRPGSSIAEVTPLGAGLFGAGSREYTTPDAATASADSALASGADSSMPFADATRTPACA